MTIEKAVEKKERNELARERVVLVLLDPNRVYASTVVYGKIKNVASLKGVQWDMVDEGIGVLVLSSWSCSKREIERLMRKL